MPQNLGYTVSVTDNGSEQLIKLREASDALKASLTNTGGTLTEAGNATRFLSEQLDPAANLAQQFAIRLGELERAGGIPPNLALDLAAVQAAGIPAADALEAFAAANKVVTSQIASAETAMLKEASGLSSVKVASEGSTPGLHGMNLEMLAMNATAGATTPALAGIAQALASIGPEGMVAAAGLSAVGAAAKSAVDWQTKLTEIQNSTTLTTKQTEDMGAAVKRVAIETGGDLNSIADGYLHIASENYKGADAFNILDTATKSAVSTGTEEASVINVLASTMREYNAQAKDAPLYMDLLHNAAAQGNSTLETFTDGARKAISVASAFKVPLDDVSAAIAALTIHYGDASVAGTQLQGMMTKITTPTAAARAEIERLSAATGIDLVHDFSAAGLAQKGFSGVLDDIARATKGNESEVLKLINAQRGGLGAFVLLTQAGGDYNRILESQNAIMAGTSTPTYDAFARTQETAGNKGAIAGEEFKQAGISIGDKLLPALTDGGSLLDKLGLAATHAGDAFGPLLAQWNAIGFVIEHTQVGIVLDFLASGAASARKQQAALADLTTQVQAAQDAWSKTASDQKNTTAELNSVWQQVFGKDMPAAIATQIAALNDSKTAQQQYADATRVIEQTVSQTHAKTTEDIKKALNDELQALQTSLDANSSGLDTDSESYAQWRAAIEKEMDNVAQAISLLNTATATIPTAGEEGANGYASGIDAGMLVAVNAMGLRVGQIMAFANEGLAKVAELQAATGAAQKAANYFSDQRENKIHGGIDAAQGNNPSYNPGAAERIGSPSGMAAYATATRDANTEGPAQAALKELKDADDKAAEAAAKHAAAAGKSADSLAKKAEAAAKAAEKARESATADLQAAADSIVLKAATDATAAAQDAAKAHTDAYAATLRGLATEMKNAGKEEKAMLAGPQADLDKASATLKNMQKDAEAALHAYDVNLHDLGEQLKTLQKEGADATAPLEANLKKAQGALASLQTAAGAMGEVFSHIMQPFEDQLYDIGQKEAAALDPMKKALQELADQMYALNQQEAQALAPFQNAIQGLDDQLYNLGQAQTAALQPLDDAIYTQNLALQAARDHASEVADVFDTRLIPLQQQLAALQYKNQQDDHNKELEDLGLSVTNLSERLANAKQGTVEYNNLLRQKQDAERNLGKKDKEYTLDDEIHSIEEAKKAAVDSANAQVTAQEKILAALQKQRDATARNFELQQRELEQEKAAQERAMELTQRQYDAQKTMLQTQMDAQQREMDLAQRDYDQQKEIVQAKLDQYNRDKALYDRQEHDKEVAAQDGVNIAQAALDQETAVQAARQKLVQDQIDQQQDLRDKKAWETSEAIRLQGLEVNDLSDRVTTIKGYYDTVKGYIQDRTDAVNDEKDAVALADQTLITSASDYEKGLQATIGARKDATAQSQALAEYTAAYGVSMSDANTTMIAMEPKFQALAPAITDTATAIKDKFVPGIQSLSTTVGPAISGVRDTMMKYLGPLDNGGDSTYSIAWYLDNHNQHGFWAEMIVKADQALGIDGLRGMWEQRLMELWADVHGSFEGEVTTIALKAAPVGVALIDGITAGVGDLVANAALQAAVAKAVDDAIAAGKKAAQSNSPSKRTYDEWGMPMMQGWANAVTDHTPLVTDAVHTAVNRTIAGGSGGYLPSYVASAGALSVAGGGGHVIDNSVYTINVSIPAGTTGLPAKGDYQAWRPYVRDITRASRAETGHPIGSK